MTTPIELNTEEQLAVDEYLRVDEAYNNANDTLEEIFKLRLVPLAEAGDIDGMRAVIAAMPESVARMYAADFLRYTRGDYDEYK